MKEKEISSGKQIVPDHIMDSLKTIGLNLYERKLYVTLLLKKSATAGELADLSGVPRARVYDVLQSLAEKGFIMIQQTKPIKYIAIPPKEALDLASKIMMEKMKSKIEMLENFKQSEAIKKLEELHQTQTSEEKLEEIVGTLKGKFIIDQHEENLLKNASQSIDILTSDAGLMEIFRKYYSTLKQAHENGIKIRIIAPITEENKLAYEELSNIAEIKDLNILKDLAPPYTRMILKDKEAGILHLTHEKETHPVHQSSLLTASRHFVSNFAGKTFDMIWKMLEEKEMENQNAQ